MNSISVPLEEVTREWERLARTWESAQAQWHDSVAAEFVKRDWSPLDAQMRGYLAAITQLNNGIAEAARDAEL